MFGLDEKVLKSTEKCNWSRAQEMLSKEETLICVINGASSHVLYKDSQGFVKSFELEKS